MHPVSSGDSPRLQFALQFTTVQRHPRRTDTRRSLEIQQERQAVEELERRRMRLMEIADLVIGAQFQATPVRDSRDYFRCPEQLKLQAVLAGTNYAQVQAEMPEVLAVAGAGQGFETFAAAVRARQEIEVAMRKLMVRRGQD